DSDLKGSAVFQLKGSHGYAILVLAGSERVDGRGQVTLLVFHRGATVSYATRATVTPTRLEADLGALGRFSAEIAPSGKKETVRSTCGGDTRAAEPRVYRGTLEFHGEEGYTDTAATEALEPVGLLARIVCPHVAGGEVGGHGLPGARLRAISRRSGRRL